MRLDEFDSFKGELKQLCATLGKAYTDALGHAYWRALKDVPLSEIEAHVERILLNATTETKFPKPAQLRTTPPTERPRITDPDFLKAEQRAIENLEELRRQNLEQWFKVIGNCNAVHIVRQHGSANVFFDPQEMCWRKVPT